MLVERGAALSKVTTDGRNLLYFAAVGGSRQCIEWVLANTSIDINSTTTIGDTPILTAII
jgi:hypothetical protein